MVIRMPRTPLLANAVALLTESFFLLPQYRRHLFDDGFCSTFKQGTTAV
jgi:hypothetical protein